MRVQTLTDRLIANWQPHYPSRVLEVLERGAFAEEDDDALVQLAWCFWVYAPSVDPGREIALQLVCDEPESVSSTQWGSLIEPLVGHFVPVQVVQADRRFVLDGIGELHNLDPGERTAIWQNKIEAASVDLSSQLARTAERLGSGEEQAGLLELARMCERYPAHIDAHLQRAMGQHRAGDREGGLETCLQISALHPFHIGVNQMLARFFIMNRMPDRALATARDILAAEPFDADAHSWLARLGLEEPPQAIVAAVSAQCCEKQLPKEDIAILNDLIKASPMDAEKIAKMVELFDRRVQTWHALSPARAGALAANIADRFRPIAAPFRAMAALSYFDADNKKAARQQLRMRAESFPNAEGLAAFMARSQLKSQRPQEFQRLLDSLGDPNGA